MCSRRRGCASRRPWRAVGSTLTARHAPPSATTLTGCSRRRRPATMTTRRRAAARCSLVQRVTPCTHCTRPLGTTPLSLRCAPRAAPMPTARRRRCSLRRRRRRGPRAAPRRSVLRKREGDDRLWRGGARALLIRGGGGGAGATGGRVRRALCGAGGAPLSRGDPRCRRARRRAACGADGGGAARGRTLVRRCDAPARGAPLRVAAAART